VLGSLLLLAHHLDTVGRRDELDGVADPIAIDHSTMDILEVGAGDLDLIWPGT
jgi:hypothetical protein